MKLINKFLEISSFKRIQKIYHFHEKAQEIQMQTLNFLIKTCSNTLWGKNHGYNKNISLKFFFANTPFSYYENLYPYIKETLLGNDNILWPGSTKLISKSSGTTNNRSKYIPITKNSLHNCHFRGGKDMLLFYLQNFPQSKLLQGKTVGVGGSLDNDHIYNKNIIIGDLSAIIMKQLPFYFQRNRCPKLEIALMSNWNEKLLLLAKESLKKNIRAIAGVPSWSLLLIKKIIEISGESSIYKVWPNFEVFFHGGVSLDPYRSAFKEILGEQFNYNEIYNASEGFFAIQDQAVTSKELLLMLDYEIFFEFIPLNELHAVNKKAIMIHEVELSKPYALIITTSGGLWRYVIGDVVEFVSLVPYRIKIIGRTTSSINIFGEELMVGNTDQAINEVCQDFKISVYEYMVAPNISANSMHGFHEWAIEFIKTPNNLDNFANELDIKLRLLNSDYDAKRKNDMLLKPLKIHSIKKGLFDKFMLARNRLGGQSKVPRLSENRIHLEQLLDFNHE